MTLKQLANAIEAALLTGADPLSEVIVYNAEHDLYDPVCSGTTGEFEKIASPQHGTYFLPEAEGFKKSVRKGKVPVYILGYED